MNSLPTELSFPKPPFRIDASLADSPPAEHALSDYLAQVRSWRLAVLELLENPSGHLGAEFKGLSERARSWLAAFLASSWSQEMTQRGLRSPYNISPFPTSALDAGSKPTLELLLETLCWRAAVVDFLCDIWDVWGEPLLDLEECLAMDAFLRPTCVERLCAFCLTEFPSEELNIFTHGCLLRSHIHAKWPAAPEQFRKWAEQAMPKERK